MKNDFHSYLKLLQVFLNPDPMEIMVTATKEGLAPEFHVPSSLKNWINCLCLFLSVGMWKIAFIKTKGHY